jgi:hypothetical protein
MKRDVDLIRQLLFDLERQGADCSLDSLRNGSPQEFDERLRYHARLLVDAGLAKEIERTSAGQPCVRLTCAGHEFLDLCRSEPRWREAKRIVNEQTGGYSLTVLRAILTKWAVDGVARSERRRRYRRAYRPQYEQVYYRDEPIYGESPYRVESYRYEREPAIDDQPIRVVRRRRVDPIDLAERWDRDLGRVDEMSADEQLGVSLPVHMI